MTEKTKGTRCAWVRPGNTLYKEYHDREWGVPVHDDQILFEFLLLESAQAGLSWETILKKREVYRQAFAQFNAKKIARFTDADVTRLINNAGIVRNRLKITSAITGAQIFLDIQKGFGSFSRYAWQFVDHTPIDGKRKSLKNVPTTTPQSESFATDMRARGWNFFGPTICYAFMQAIGMVNDHTTDCFRYDEVKKLNNERKGKV